jgi:hypothetical protein
VRLRVAESGRWSAASSAACHVVTASCRCPRRWWKVVRFQARCQTVWWWPRVAAVRWVGQQGGVLGVHPGQCRGGVGQRVRVHAGRGRLGPHERAVGVQEAVGGVGGVQVEVPHPGQGCVPHLLGQGGVGGVCGVAADQVVHGVAAARPPFQQGGVLQHVQRPVGEAVGQAGEGGGGGWGGVGTGGDAQQCERGALGVGEPAQGPGQHRGQAGGRVGVVIERLQAEVVQFGGGLGQRSVGAGAGGARGDRQRQRVASAQPDQLVHCLGFGGDAVGV